MAEVGVADPYAKASARKKEWPDSMVWNEAVTAGHPFLAHAPKGALKDLRHEVTNFAVAFGEWDGERQTPLYFVRGASGYATALVQDGVLGKGKVAFSALSRAFSDWYELKAFGNALVSWLIGMPADEHRAKAQDFAGGPGEAVQ